MQLSCLGVSVGCICLVYLLAESVRCTCSVGSICTLAVCSLLRKCMRRHEWCHELACVVLPVQAAWRMHVCRAAYTAQRRAAVVFQGQWRVKKAKRELQRLRVVCTLLPASPCGLLTQPGALSTAWHCLRRMGSASSLPCFTKPRYPFPVLEQARV